jgi:hypothetical protein
MMTKIICQNPRCRHVDQVHDENGCVMLGCDCPRLELGPPPVDSKLILPKREFFPVEQAA